LALLREVDRLHVARCLPAHWDALGIHYRYRETVYHIAVSQTRAGDDRGRGVMSVTVDGIECRDKAIPHVDDQQEHSVEVRVPAA
jgi:cyclic beta-1,2-glucan synthetase